MSTEKLLEKYTDRLSKEDLRLIKFGILYNIPIIVDGRPGPTGKSMLANDLEKLGAEVAEMWEMEEGDKQHYKKSDKNTAYILITLNEFISI